MKVIKIYVALNFRLHSLKKVTEFIIQEMLMTI